MSASSPVQDAAELQALEGLRIWLMPYQMRIGGDYERYFNHCARVLLLSRRILQVMGTQGWPQLQWEPELYCAAVAFHDLGLWTRGDWDYLPPSIEELKARLAPTGASAEKVSLAAQLIDLHHRVRPLPTSEGWAHTEAFRRADTCEVTMGLLSFGVSRSEMHEILERFPRKGFIWMLVKRFLHRMVTKPWSPIPMFRW